MSDLVIFSMNFSNISTKILNYESVKKFEYPNSLDTFLKQLCADVNDRGLLGPAPSSRWPRPTYTDNRPTIKYIINRYEQRT